MTRVTGEPWRDELDLLIEDLMDGGDDLHDPTVVLERVQAGRLTDSELEEVHARALGALHGIEAANHAEDLGAVRTGPAGAAERMRARRDANAAMWRQVLEAIGARVTSPR